MIKPKIQIIKGIRFFLEQAQKEKEKYTSHIGAFTKPKKLTFTLVVAFLLNLPKRSLSIELEDFYKQLLPEKLACTKSAFSQARYKLKHEFFIDWNKELVKSFYKNNDLQVQRWGNYLLQGVDGTTVHLMERDEIKEEFGCHPNQAIAVPMALILNRVDVLNNIIVDGMIAPIHEGEKNMAIAQLDKVSENVISIYDRNFTSFEFIYEHLQRNLQFIIRSNLAFNNIIKDFTNSDEISAIVEFNATEAAIRNLKKRGIKLTKEDKVKVRLIRVELENGTTEILISSLMDEEKFPSEDFKELYNLRWKTETSFDALKNKLQLGAFSGHMPEAIRQDFHALIFAANLNSILIEDCKEEIKEISEKRIFDYAVNRNVSIGLMKYEIVKLFINDQQDISMILQKIKKSFLRHLEPIKPGRSFVRTNRMIARKSKYNTLTNYRRAI